MPRNPDHLDAAREQFIALWGQMGSAWGIPRTMAEMHALLFISPESLNADEVMARLDISRGNASMTLRKLLDWGIIHRVHRRGDRKDYYEAEQDILRLFRTILRERKKREFEPMLNALHDTRALTAPDQPDTSARLPDDADLIAHNEKLDRLLEFVELADAISDNVIDSSDEALKLAAKLFAAAS